MKVKFVIPFKGVIMLVIVLALVATVAAAPAPFISPVPPMCPQGQVCGDGYLPWRPTPPPREPKKIEQPAVNAELSKRGECIVRARAWGVDEARCE